MQVQGPTGGLCGGDLLGVDAAASDGADEHVDGNSKPEGRAERLAVQGWQQNSAELALSIENGAAFHAGKTPEIEEKQVALSGASPACVPCANGHNAADVSSTHAVR